jgi:hypothetical protein
LREVEFKKMLIEQGGRERRAPNFGQHLTSVEEFIVRSKT